MSLTTQIVSGSISALNLIKNYLANPSLAPQAIPGGDTPIPLIAMQVPIQCESYKEVLDSDVSQQLIIDSDSGHKSYATDNIAPKPRVWELKGFIGAAPWEMIVSPILQIVQSQRLTYLREMRKSRDLLVFRTKNGTEYVWVAIKAMTVDSDPAIQNRIPITMTLQEVPILSFLNGSLGIPDGVTNPAALGELAGTLLTATVDIAAIVAGEVGTTLDAVVAGAASGSDESFSNRQIEAMYQVPIPTMQPNQVATQFTARVGTQSYTVALKWMNEAWSMFVTLPTGEVRDAKLLPNVWAWSAFTDISMIATTTLESIGLNDLDEITLYAARWA